MKICLAVGAAVVGAVLCTPLHARAQEPARSSVESAASATTDQPEPSVEIAQDVGENGAAVTPKPDRILGVLPNYTMVEEGAAFHAITTRQMFQMATMSSFDPYVFPFVGFVAELGQGRARAGFATRYQMTLADNSIGNFLTTAIVPSLAGQDPRYFERGTGGLVRRLGYAASRSLVTRSRSGRPQFNVSEIGGNALAAGLSNIYAAPAERTLASTLTRWTSQVMWDTVGNELKEFWPDIRRAIHRR